jgi:hypothetical protein
MTEAEWLAATDPKPMLEFLRGKATDRKFRLLAVACCRAVREVFIAPVDWKLIDLVDHQSRLDGRLNIDLAAYCYRPFVKIHSGQTPLTQVMILGLTAQDAWEAARATASHLPNFATDGGRDNVERWLCRLVRDIFGNPFRRIAFDPGWRTDNVRALAIGMDEVGTCGLMPVLADALQDAGCDNVDILSHCRSDGPHVRGCWVVDLVLGKE